MTPSEFMSSFCSLPSVKPIIQPPEENAMECGARICDTPHELGTCRRLPTCLPRAKTSPACPSAQLRAGAQGQEGGGLASPPAPSSHGCCLWDTRPLSAHPHACCPWAWPRPPFCYNGESSKFPFTGYCKATDINNCEILCLPKPYKYIKIKIQQPPYQRSEAWPPAWEAPSLYLVSDVQGCSPQPRRTRSITLTSNPRHSGMYSRTFWQQKGCWRSGRNTLRCVCDRQGEQNLSAVLRETLGYLYPKHLLIIYCFHSGSACHSGSGEDLSSSMLYIPLRTGALVLQRLETSELPQVQQRFSTETELLSDLINLQAGWLAEQLMCTLAPSPPKGSCFCQFPKKLLYSYPHCSGKANVIAFNITSVLWSFD